MSIVTCDDLQQFYTDPTNSETENGVQIYGDATLFFASQGGCGPSVPAEVVYNSFCGTPSLVSTYKETCANLLNIDNAKDNVNLIFNKIITQTYPSFGYTNIPQFASYAYHPLNFSTLTPLIQSSFDGSTTASLGLDGNLAIATSDNIELQSYISNVVAFCMANENGLIYYINLDGHTFTLNPITGTTQQISLVPIVNLPIRMISAALPNIAMACISLDDLDNIYQFDFVTQQWNAMPLPATVVTFNLEMTIDFAGTTLIFGAATAGNSTKPYISYPFPSSNPIELNGLFGPLNSFSSCAPFLIRNQTNDHLEMLSIWESSTSGTFISVNDIISLTSDIVVQPSDTDDFSLGISWSPQGNQYICFTQYHGLFYSKVRPTDITDWILISTNVQTSNNLTSIPSLSLSIASQVIYWPEYIPSTMTFAIRCATFNENPLSYFLNSLSNVGSFYLLDNGEIRCYNNSNLTSLVWVSSTSDQSIPSETLISNKSYVPILPDANPLTVSKNGLYALSFDIDTGLYELLQNVINGTEIMTWGGPTKEAPLRTAYKGNYCAFLPKNTQTGTITDTYPDPRCLCYNPRELTASLFNIDLLAANPAQLALVDSFSPCLFNSCTETRDTGTITASLMDEVIECPSTINLCSTIIQVGQDGAITAGTGGVNVDTNCGGTAGQTPCSSTCPIGTGCAKDGFCSLLCDSNADCTGAGQKCLKGVCESSTSSGESLPDWAIAVIVIGVVLLLIGIGFGIYYARKR